MDGFKISNAQKHTIQKMVVASLLVALVAQVNLELFESGFVVSAGVVLYVIFLYYYENINPILFGFLSGTMILILRLVVYQFFQGVTKEVVYSYTPEVIFYVIYSVFFMLFSEGDKKNNPLFIYVLCILCDFASNYVEVFVRYTVLEQFALAKTVPTLIVVSFIRSTVVWIVMTAFNYYNMMLTKKEHEERYKRLLLLTSQLKTEMYWIEKNMVNVGRTVSLSYELYEKINNNTDRDSWADMSLTIARNINEIKKDNELVFRGIKDISEKELKDKGMEYKDINNILSEAMKKETKRCNKEIDFEFSVGENFYTMNHYYLMCVLRNLIINSMDSIRKEQRNAKICVIHEDNEMQHVFKVCDNGSGIAEEYLNQIFLPGFSTKISHESGDVNRGLGLSIVKYIVEEQLKGEIEIDSKVELGTTVTISVPRVYLDEKVLIKSEI